MYYFRFRCSTSEGTSTAKSVAMPMTAIMTAKYLSLNAPVTHTYVTPAAINKPTKPISLRMDAPLTCTREAGRSRQARPL